MTAAMRSQKERLVDASDIQIAGVTYRYVTLGQPQLVTLEVLTEAERDVVNRVMRGCSNREIAALRDSSLSTVDNQLVGIYSKLGIHSRHELIEALSGTLARA